MIFVQTRLPIQKKLHNQRDDGHGGDHDERGEQEGRRGDAERLRGGAHNQHEGHVCMSGLGVEICVVSTEFKPDWVCSGSLGSDGEVGLQIHSSDVEIERSAVVAGGSEWSNFLNIVDSPHTMFGLEGDALGRECGVIAVGSDGELRVGQDEASE